MDEIRIAVIGGSGLYEMEGLTDVHEVRPKTPFGEPSDAITIGRLDDRQIAFLPRHGVGHRINPTNLPARANIYALKSLGVEWTISVSAVGSLREEIRPLDMVVPDQIIDRTRNRVNTFFEEGIVAHIGFAEPFCPVLSSLLISTTEGLDVPVHRGGTYVVMEGPAFSTKAESRLYRSWGCDIIGMTAIPEAKLAREAEICYATLACATDYDVWHETEAAVSVEMIIANLLRNVETSKKVIRGVIGQVPLADRRDCTCSTALRDAIVTAPDRIPDQIKKDLAPIIGKYLK